MKTRKIVVLGSCNTDMVIKSDRLPVPGETILGKELLENVSIIIPNNTEAEILSGIKVSDIESAKNATDIISQKGIETVIITMGDYGAFIKTKEEYISVPTQKVNAIDTTAAGDTFCGALVVALSEGKDIIDAVKFANKCSGITVTRLGAQSSCPYRNEVI